MSEFSSMLGSLIEEKGIKVYSMAKYCLLDRSTMYKVINGTRKPPSMEAFHKMADFMRLTPMEYDMFLKAYEISILGKDVYYKRKNMENFMCGFPTAFSVPPLQLPEDFTVSAQIEWEKKVPEFVTITNQTELNHTIYHMFLAESEKPRGRIGMLLQPDRSFAFGLLAGQLSTSRQLHIDHLVCLDHATRMTEEHESYTLMYLKNLLPLYASSLDYHSYCFYDDIPSRYYNFSGTPFLILTEDFALTCCSDYSAGFFYGEKKAVGLLWSLFEDYKSKCDPLFRVLRTVEEECEVFGAIDAVNAENYIIQPEPCLIPYITREMLEREIYQDIPERESFIKYLWSYIEGKGKAFPSKNTHMYNTKNGLLHFAATGRLSEIPAEIYRPFAPEDRKELLLRLKEDCGEYGFHLLKRPLAETPHDFHLWISDYYAFLFFSNVRKQNVYLDIREPGLLEDMMTFAAGIGEDQLYSQEETEAYIQRLVDSIVEEE